MRHEPCSTGRDLLQLELSSKGALASMKKGDRRKLSSLPATTHSPAPRSAHPACSFQAIQTSRNVCSSTPVSFTLSFNVDRPSSRPRERLGLPSVSRGSVAEATSSMLISRRTSPAHPHLSQSLNVFESFGRAPREKRRSSPIRRPGIECWRRGQSFLCDYEEASS